MTKNSTILTVSMSKEQAQFLIDQDLSPSDLIQEKIREQKRIFEQYNQEKAKLLTNIEFLQKEIRDMVDFIELVGKFDDWKKWRGENVLAKEK